MLVRLNINNCVLRAGTLVSSCDGICGSNKSLLMSMFVTSLHLTSFQFDPNAKQEASTRNAAFCQAAEPKDISKQNVAWAAAPKQGSAAWSDPTKHFVSYCPKGKPFCIHGWHGLEQSQAWVDCWTRRSYWLSNLFNDSVIKCCLYSWGPRFCRSIPLLACPWI